MPNDPIPTARALGLMARLAAYKSLESEFNPDDRSRLRASRYQWLGSLDAQDREVIDAIVTLVQDHIELLVDELRQAEESAP